MNDELIHKIYLFAEKVQPVYALLEWGWHGEGVPTVPQIVETLKRLIGDADDSNTIYRATGGLYVQRDTEDRTTWSFGLDLNGGFYHDNDVRG